MASCSARQELLLPGLSSDILTGVSLINVSGDFGAFPSHFPVVSATPAPFTAHSSSALQWARTGCPLQHCLWCFPNPPGAIRDVGAERGTEAIAFLLSAVPGDDVGALGFFPPAWLLQQNPPQSAVLSPAAGSRLGVQCGAAGSAFLSPLGHLAPAKTQPMLAPHWAISSSNGCSQPLQNNGLGMEGQLVFQEKTVMDYFYLSFSLLPD